MANDESKGNLKYSTLYKKFIEGSVKSPFETMFLEQDIRMIQNSCYEPLLSRHDPSAVILLTACL